MRRVQAWCVVVGVSVSVAALMEVRVDRWEAVGRGRWGVGLGQGEATNFPAQGRQRGHHVLSRVVRQWSGTLRGTVKFARGGTSAEHEDSIGGPRHALEQVAQGWWELFRRRARGPRGGHKPWI